MKKGTKIILGIIIVFAVLFFGSAIIAGIYQGVTGTGQTVENNSSDNKNTEEIKSEDKQEDSISKEAISSEDIMEIIKDDVGKGEKITDAKIEDRTIVVNINIGTEEKIPLKDLAVSRYSSISDDLLEHNFWDVLTVNFENVGSISMNKNESNGTYFETSKIEEKLK